MPRPAQHKFKIMYPKELNVALSTWKEEDRPREKMLRQGSRSLSETELLAILVGSGIKGENAIDLARRVLAEAGNDLAVLARLSPEYLCRVKGIGEARAIQIVAALELGRRRQAQSDSHTQSIRSSSDVYRIFRPILMDHQHEEFWILLLNRANRVMGKQMISKGGLSGTVADPKVIYHRALLALSSAVILVHNHPSGNASPSQADREITRKLRNAGEFLDLPVLDHVIVTDHAYYSFADEGIL